MKKARILTVIVCMMATVDFASAETIRGINIDFVTIGYAGNAGDTQGMNDGTTGYGAVGYNYRIGKYEVTNVQWNAFTAAVGTPTGNDGGYSYSAYYGGAQQPTNNVSWYEALQFCNYLTSGDKSKGVYQFSGNNANPGSFLGINRDAAKAAYGTIYFLPTEDEWHKAAYYRPNGSGYSLYANGFNMIPTADNGWNYYGGAYSEPWNVGTGTMEQNGTYDMMGNVYEWNETLGPASYRIMRGGSFWNGDVVQLAASCRGNSDPSSEYYFRGFRVASIPEPTIPPIANAGSEQTVTDADDNGSELITLNGSGSSDPDGSIVSYIWSEQGNQIATGVNPNVTLPVGTHVITLTVTDDDGLTDTDTVTVTVQPFPNQPPVSNAGSDQTVTDIDDNGSEQVTLDGSGSTDSDGTIQSYVWSEGGTQIATGVNPNITLSIGQHTITLTVTDDDGLTDTNAVTVTVEPYPNQPPVANADGPYTIYVGDTLTLDASGSTEEHNNIVSYSWDLDDSNSFETDAGSQAVFDVNYTYLQSLGLLVNNTYNIRLKVTDGEGLSDVNNTTLTIIPIPALLVIVDIKPGSCPNPLNVKSSGVLPVAILGTGNYDITTIDPTSIRLAGVEPLRNSLEDVAGPVADSNDCNCTEDGPDGFLDLTLKFKTQKIVEAIGDVNEGDVLTLELTGVLIGERPIEGTDCILISGKHKPCNKFDINKDGVVNSQDFAIFAENWLQSSIVED